MKYWMDDQYHQATREQLGLGGKRIKQKNGVLL